MPSLITHYQQLLGLPETWKVSDVRLSTSGPRIEIHLEYIGPKVECPECGKAGRIYDLAPEQRWRHLDTMEYETHLIARVPRCECKEHRIKTIQVPWATRYSRYTLKFEALAVELLQECSSIQSASRLLRLNWHATNEIMNRAVKRGLSRRNKEAIAHLGLDEKSFRAGHQYVTILNDLKGGRVLEVVQSRTTDGAEALLLSFEASQRQGVKSISMDMWKPFAIAAKKHLPQADIVHDRFHISKYLNEAVDTVRRQESRQLHHAGDRTLIGSKFTWLRNPENMTESQRTSFDQLMACELKTGKAWSMKNMFREFWRLGCRESASFFFDYWSERVDQLALKPMIKVKELLKRHLDNILNYFEHEMTNAVSEGLNSKIQLYKASARGFHSFHSYRIRILFYCGKLNMAITG
ncbi:ISL3 family transposase [Chlorobaculum limnaeum]|uniref:ISL3 family transposase n=1 Tax=Chlorobaculum limnaeum TaxID=274537 RepID=A0A1D8D753_CHLLM|nr:ISL3 family transposase [Chlorobaculum limnaeum]AOS82892.1 ISL3 family transposase [Chlorobaculum limnaeum]AOS82980.1 ISL3 family transposase [Chlorobaculum limnaeum]AOS83059.1 ISL3 family transposase [Chlorobaculum limnaeum]AOS83069.1 ISL3 family transposase [Chlorobaculum limnaeum]AOS83172.1 ISL3 family transposase [Chlorobaculum limnaeum]